MKTNHCKRIIFFLFFNTFFLAVNYVKAQENYKPIWESIDSRPIPQWFSDAKFGIFIHWGIYSVPAWAPADASIGIFANYAEWYGHRINEDSKIGELFREHNRNVYGENFNYQDFAPYFKAENFDPVRWTETIKKSGAKYVVLTSKHHDGFTLWPSEQSWNWNSTDIGPHRDLCGDLTKAVKDAGLYMGLYYSLYEWYNPMYLSNLEQYVDCHMIPQMKDMVIQYKPDILWTDGEGHHLSEKWKSTDFLAWLYNDSPVKDRICVNDRWGKETRGAHGGYYTTEYNLVHNREGVGETNQPWEECRGIGMSFGYNRMESTKDYMTSDKLVDLLIKTVANGGNLLLNIGPTADGRIPVIQQQRLLDIGAWLCINGEAIYGTRKWGDSENKDFKNIYFTKKGNDLYILCTEFPEEPIVIKGINNIKKVSMLGFAGNIKSKRLGDILTITTPDLSPLINPSQYAWVFKVENALLKN